MALIEAEPNAVEVPRSLTATEWLHSLLFWSVHVAALLVFFVPFSWSMVALCLGLYAVKMFGITAGYHRYFSHKSFRTSRAGQFVLALTGLLAVQKGPIWWAAHHRHHHLHSDDEQDFHSPGRQGFWWSHLGWILSRDHRAADRSSVPDLMRFPELVWLDRFHLVPGVTLAVWLFLAGGLPALAWGFFLSTVLTWHATFAINSLTHIFGRRRYATGDDSRNSFLLALFTFGEGWHNNHHHYMAATRQGFYWWEVDFSYYLLKVLSWCGLVWQLREPPREVLEEGRGG